MQVRAGAKRSAGAQQPFSSSTNITAIEHNVRGTAENDPEDLQIFDRIDAILSRSNDHAVIHQHSQ